MQGAWVLFLVRELRSQMLSSLTRRLKDIIMKIKEKRKKKKRKKGPRFCSIKGRNLNPQESGDVCCFWF